MLIGKWNEKYQAYFRDGTLDEYVWKEQSTYKDLLPLTGETVLDIGGNIGAFCRYALDNGATRVVSFEPDPNNLQLYSQNTKQKAMGFAVTSDAGLLKQGVVPFFINSKKNKGSHTLFETRGRDAIEVSVMSFRDAIKTDRFTVAKIDIEGGEYLLDYEELFNSNINRFAIEFHLNRKNEKEHAVSLHQMFCKHFTPVKTPVLNKKNWTTLGVYSR